MISAALLRPLSRLLVCAAGALLASCATIERSSRGDPFEPLNRPIYQVNDALDRALMLPVAKVYRKVTPVQLRHGVTNFFINISYLNVIANDLLQAKGKLFVQDLTRLVVNSTIGIGGLFDPASEMGLPQHDEDLGQTFGVWGAHEGAYLVVPMLGPNSVRDLPDLASNQALNPLTYTSLALRWPLLLLELVNMRADLIDETRAIEAAALDPYIYVREGYRQQREYLIHDGNPPIPELEDL